MVVAAAVGVGVGVAAVAIVRDSLGGFPLRVFVPWFTTTHWLRLPFRV